MKSCDEDHIANDVDVPRVSFVFFCFFLWCRVLEVPTNGEAAGGDRPMGDRRSAASP